MGLPAFQLPMFPECDAVPKEISWTCLFKVFFGNSNHPLPARSRFLRAAERSTCFALWLHPAHPFVAATENKECVSCKEAECLVTELWLQDLLQPCDCALSCAVRLLQTNEHLSRLRFLQQWVGSGAASLSAVCRTCLFFQKSLSAIHFGYSKHPLLARSFRFLTAAVRSTCFALWLHHADPFVAATEKECASCKEAECLATELWLQDLLQYCDCDLSCGVKLLQTKKHLSRLSF